MSLLTHPPWFAAYNYPYIMDLKVAILVAMVLVVDSVVLDPWYWRTRGPEHIRERTSMRKKEVCRKI